jgi:protein-export chaperone SecB
MVSANSGAASTVAAGKVFSMSQVLLKTVSFDAPLATELPRKPDDIDMDKVELSFATKAWRFLNDRYALEVRFDVQASRKGVSAFHAVVEEIGTFRVVGYTEEQIGDLLRTRGVEAIYPYARELIHSLASRCGAQRLGLPAVALGLVNETPSSLILEPPPGETA